MCQVLKVSSSGYYKWLHKTPSNRELNNLIIVKEIYQVYKASNRRYGGPRIAKELNMQEIKVSQPLTLVPLHKRGINGDTYAQEV